jgi:hypothetical protein
MAISRFPFEAQITAMPPEHQYVIRNLWNAVADVQNAIPILKSQIGGKTTSSTTSSTSSGSGGGSETVILETGSSSGVSSFNGNTGAVTGVSSFNNLTGAVTYMPQLGFVNNQTGVTTYSTQQSDAGTYIILDDALPIAVTLNTGATAPAVSVPWVASFLNYGAGTATLTPASGTISYQGNVGSASMPLTQGCAAVVAFDGINYWAELVPIGGGTGTITGVTAGTGLTGGGSSGNVTLAIASTPVTPGSYTNTNFTVNQQGQVTAATNGSASGYPTVAASALSTTLYTGSYSWTSPALVAGAAYRLTVYLTAGSLSASSVTGTFGFTDSFATYSPVTIASISLPGGAARNFSSQNVTFYNAPSSTITVNFTVTGTISYSPQVIILERLA